MSTHISSLPTPESSKDSPENGDSASAQYAMPLPRVPTDAYKTTQPPRATAPAPNPTPAYTAHPTSAAGPQHAQGSYFPPYQPFGPALGLLNVADILNDHDTPPEIKQSPPDSRPASGLNIKQLPTLPKLYTKSRHLSKIPLSKFTGPITAGTSASASTSATTIGHPSNSLTTTTSLLKQVRKSISPEDRYAKDIVDRIFARFAKDVGGIDLDGKVFWHFDDATRPSASAWPPTVLEGLLDFYVTHGKGRNKKNAKVTHKSLLRFARNLRRFYSDNKWSNMDAATVKAGTRRCARLKPKCAPLPTNQLFDMESMFALSNAVWSPDYDASFRQRIDMSLYLALVLGTGTQSNALLALEMPEYNAAYAANLHKDGARWGDFKLFMTNNGPLISFTRRLGTQRTFCVNSGPTLGLSTGELVTIAMTLDGVIVGDLSLEYLLSPRYWTSMGNTFREVDVKPSRGELHVFRHFRTNNPLRRSEINRELHRLGQIARLGQVVTTGTIRRMVAEKIYALHGFEICNAIMDHKTLPKTRRYLTKTQGRKIETHEMEEVGAWYAPEHRAQWQALSRVERMYRIQREPNYVLPSTWTDPAAPASPSPPTPSPVPKNQPNNPFLSNFAAWMAGPKHYFRQHVAAVRDITQYAAFERVPTTDAEYQHELELFFQKYTNDLEEVWDEEDLDSDDE